MKRSTLLQVAFGFFLAPGYTKKPFINPLLPLFSSSHQRGTRKAARQRAGHRGSHEFPTGASSKMSRPSFWFLLDLLWTNSSDSQEPKEGDPETFSKAHKNLKKGFLHEWKQNRHDPTDCRLDVATRLQKPSMDARCILKTIWIAILSISLAGESWPLTSCLASQRANHAATCLKKHHLKHTKKSEKWNLLFFSKHFKDQVFYVPPKAFLRHYLLAVAQLRWRAESAKEKTSKNQGLQTVESPDPTSWLGDISEQKMWQVVSVSGSSLLKQSQALWTNQTYTQEET